MLPFLNKVLQLLMQTLIKCTSLNLIFAGVSSFLKSNCKTGSNLTPLDLSHNILPSVQASLSSKMWLICWRGAGGL